MASRQRLRAAGDGASYTAGGASSSEEERPLAVPRATRRQTVLAGKWLLGEELGKGAHGQVYKGIDQRSGAVVAIKEISIAGIGAVELEGIRGEIELLQRLDHENVVKYLGSVQTERFLYIILEYVENGSLSSVTRPSRFGCFPEPLCALYVAQTLEGLAYLHEQGVVHRDIKGANILTTKDGLVKLADFGVATQRAKGKGDTNVPSAESSAPAGTPYWMAPEVIELSASGPAMDIWSVGCTVVELLTGAPPYFELQAMPALFRVVNDPHPPLPAHASPLLEGFLMRCWAKNPDERPAARELLRDPWIVEMRRDLRSSWPASRHGEKTAREGVGSVVDRMLGSAAEEDAGPAGAAVARREPSRRLKGEEAAEVARLSA
eukprot:CAMPEP_0183794576 /NCGR_PEP_ID=MMETSP0803_2-20130417/3921_1 /TAXON_ID=195967 /ORGANISM="Crustomastix stigmata, Strain CCMP3273" /LENGTH=377 /DNA_ID=CAMNT_0026038981 /DNA_START=124 /DNA_END=1253 /DNA_ORIENTATION=-